MTKYQILNQSNKILASYATLAECAADLRRRHGVEVMGARAVYKIEREDGERMNEDERAELWCAQMAA